MIQSYVDKNYEEQYDKEIIKVLVLTGPKTNGTVTYESEVNGRKVYSGMLWDMFQALKNLPELNKYKFEYTFSDPTRTSYDKTIDMISSDNYDLGLSFYSQTAIRESKINYTVPIAINGLALFHYSKTGTLSGIKNVLSHIGYQFLLLIFLGIIAGIILFVVDPRRSKALNIKNRKVFFIRSITTGIAAFFGEGGFLFENTSSSIKGVVAAVLLMLVSIIFLQFIQAEITSLLIAQKTNNEIPDSEIVTKVAMGHDGYAETTKWEEMGGKVERFKRKTNVELIEIYKKNPNKYLGVILAYYDGFPVTVLNPGIVASLFGKNTPVCLAYNPRNPNFGEALNRGILHLRATGEIQKICKSYFETIGPNAPPVCTL